MKKFWLCLTFALQSLLWNNEASAAPCVSASLASYQALGAGGCTIGAFRFSDFGLLQRPTGATAFASISVTPVIVGTTLVGVDFGVTPTSTSNSAFFDDLIRYRVSGTSGGVTSATLALNGFSADGFASVTGVENLCLGGTFAGVSGVDGCTTGPSNAPALVVVDASPQSTGFGSAAALAVVTDIGLDSGPFGDVATLTSVSNRFGVVAAVTPVPEPAPALLIAAGAIALQLSRRAARQANGRV